MEGEARADRAVDYRFLGEINEYSRAYYRGPDGALHCLQKESFSGATVYNFYRCTSDGNPGKMLATPERSQFNEFHLPD